MTKTPTRTGRERFASVLLLALIAALAPGLAACTAAPEGPPADEDDFGIDGELYPDEPLGKADSAGVPGPRVMTWTGDTQVWTARNAWEDTDTPAARAAGIAWPADSGLDWEQKFRRWVASMERTASASYFDTFTLTTPWNKTLPAPKLECAEMAMFLRITFAAWYELPFYLTALDGSGTRIYFGHFGARTKTSRYKSTPKYAYWYKDYSDWNADKIASEGWPTDDTLRSRGLYGGGDEMPFIGEGARAGAYFDEIHLNKRVGHFLRLILAYFGSMHLAGSRNTYNLKPEAVQPGDVLVERWQRSGIGHTLVVKEVRDLHAGVMEAELVSGSMPRRQPKWEDPVASKRYFTLPETGGEGTNSDGEEYVKLGGGLKRFRVTKNINGYWTNTWMAEDEASWINDTDYPQLKARPARLSSLLGEVAPEDMRDALLAIVEDARNHLRQYPASCSARIKREDAFGELYELMQEEFASSPAQVDEQYRILEDYVFKKLEYTKSKTCCWNSTSAAMFQIAMDYNQEQMANQCVQPTVFKCQGGGYQVFADYAQQTGRGHLWRPWSEDESCPQRDVVDDIEIDTASIGWCAVSAAGGGEPSTGGCQDDGYEDNDGPASASAVAAGSHGGLKVCSGDDDYFEFELGAGETLDVSITFDHGEGDIDLAIYRGSERIDLSQSISDGESVSASGAGSYTVHVYGYSGAEASYALSASVQ